MVQCSSDLAQTNWIVLTNAYVSQSPYVFEEPASRPALLSHSRAFGVETTSGPFAPNGYGLYDMAGNLNQWCWDRYDSYSAEPQTDPHGPDGDSYRVMRGGTWNIYAFDARGANRDHSAFSDVASFDLGFRTVLPVSQP